MPDSVSLEQRVHELERGLEQVVLRDHEVETATGFRDARYAELNSALRRLEEQVHKMDLRGTELTQERFRRYEERVASVAGQITDLKAQLKEKATVESVQELKDDARALRLTMRGAIVTFATSVAVQVFIYFTLKGG